MISVSRVLPLALALLALAPASAHAATFTVNSTGDQTDVTPGNGVCATAGGQCTLRAAIVEANNLMGADTINVPAGTYTTGSVLAVSTNVTINGAGAIGDAFRRRCGKRRAAGS